MRLLFISGPTAILSLMLQQYISSNPDYAILLCFLSGCIILGCGLLNLGFLVRFISSPVTVGFTCAAAVTIASGQINALLGIPSEYCEGNSDSCTQSTYPGI